MKLFNYVLLGVKNVLIGIAGSIVGLAVFYVVGYPVDLLGVALTGGASTGHGGRIVLGLAALAGLGFIGLIGAAVRQGLE